jgi:hypothetical protein
MGVWASVRASRNGIGFEAMVICSNATCHHVLLDNSNRYQQAVLKLHTVGKCEAPAFTSAGAPSWGGVDIILRRRTRKQRGHAMRILLGIAGCLLFSAALQSAAAMLARG